MHLSSPISMHIYVHTAQSSIDVFMIKISAAHATLIPNETMCSCSYVILIAFQTGLLAVVTVSTYPTTAPRALLRSVNCLANIACL